MPTPRSNNSNSLVADDGLPLPEVGPWALTKHRKIEYYASLFARSMLGKWKCRVYLDLFACAGKSRISGSSQIIPGSPLLALGISCPFDQYVFCEKDPTFLDSLRSRVGSSYPNAKCSYIQGDSNSHIEEIISAIPRFDKNNTGLTFCLVDPYKASECKFRTIKELASRLYVDFLVLIPSFMDINRNYHCYSAPENTTIDEYLGTNEWRSIWQQGNSPISKFGVFVVDQYCKQMHSLGYLYESMNDLELVRMDTGNNLPLYHLAFFSRNKLGLKFWRETRKRTTDQLQLWD